MKTQIITTAIAIALSMSLNNAAANNSSEEKSKKAEMLQEQAIDFAIEAEAQLEKDLSIEDWMVDEKLWKLDQKNGNSKTNKTSSIESWMYSDTHFRVESGVYKNIESWMIDKDLWRY